MCAEMRVFSLLLATFGLIGDVAAGMLPPAFPAGTLQRLRTEKRAEVISRLSNLIEVESNRGDRSGKCIAEMGKEDLAQIGRLFADEVSFWEKYPLAPNVTARTLNLHDYGAKGDGVDDDTEAFDRAMKDLKAFCGEPSILEIPPGTYRFSSLGRMSQFRVEGLSNCVIRGDPAGKVRFEFADYNAIGLELSSCTNVTVSGVELSMAETPFAQGTICDFDMNLGFVDIIHDEGTLLPTDDRFAKRPNSLSCALFDESGRQVLGQEAFFDRRAEKLAHGAYRVYLDRRHVAFRRLRLQKGWKIVVCDRDNAFPMVRARGSYLCNFDHVTVLNSRSAAFGLAGSYYPSLWHVRVVPKSAGLMVSSNADGAFLPRGAFVAHSEFSHTNDDGCNCLSYGRLIREVENENVVVAEELKGNYAPGSLMLIVSSNSGEFMWSGRVCEAGKIGGSKWHRTVFEAPIPEDVISLKTMGRSDWTLKEKRDLVHGRIQVGRMADQLYRPYAWGTSFVMVDCSFKSLRGTGAVVQCADALIENCRFEFINTGMSLTGLLGWNEGPAPYNVVVRNCTFVNVRVGISSAYRNMSGEVLRSKLIRGVELKGNRFGQCSRDIDCPSAEIDNHP